MGFLYAAAGGAIGAAFRYLAGVVALKLLGASFPWATLFVNVFGSFLMGVLFVVFLVKYPTANELKIFMMTGVLGGFTTFSAFSLDFITLVERKAQFAAAFYLGSSVLLSILALVVGMSLMRQILH